MIIEILPEQCIACGLCHTYNKVFDYDIDGLVRFENDETVLEIPSDPSLTQAAKTCPTHAIKIKSELTWLRGRLFFYGDNAIHILAINVVFYLLYNY